MLLRRLVLENYGVFRDRNELDLAPQDRYRKKRPVVLIGGKNGSGKTTLLEALRLCLYGPQALGLRLNSKEYENYLVDRIHRPEKGDSNRPAFASVGMEFEYSQAGIRHIYWVERRWNRSQGSFRNGLTVQRDGKPLDELDQTHANDFLRDLIPQGVSQLFFFDGEKIQQLADSEQDHVSLAEATRGLIGLDLLDRLQDDLRVVSSKVKDSSDEDPLAAEAKALTTERQESELRRRELVAQLDVCRSRLDRLRQEEAKEEQRLTRAGGRFASQRESLHAEREQLLVTIVETERDIRELGENLLPFTLATNLCRSLRTQLSNEGKVLLWNSHGVAIRERIVQAKRDVANSLVSDLGKEEIGPKVRKAISKRMDEILDGLAVPPKNLPNVALIHKQSDDKQRRLLLAIESVLNDVPKQLSKSQRRLERSTRRLREVEAGLKKIPQDEIIQPILERIRDLQLELGAAQVEVDRADTSLREIDLKLIDIARRERKFNEKSAEAKKKMNRGVLIAKVQLALAEYADLLTGSKIRELRDAVVRCFAQLWRKGDIVRRIEINPTTFRVTLFDRHDRMIPKQQLSAGEKQVYAISLLWALGQVSGRPLPMVIDTPLGRLDSDHRGHLVERYFPHASHQVIILSTDTEIDQAFFKVLVPSISHSYHLRYDAADACCVIEKGYFWQGQKLEAANAIE